MQRSLTILALLLGLCTTACDQTWNNPHQSRVNTDNINYASFSEPPKTLDPAKSYTVDESRFTGSIYESPYQYNYLQRPYVLEPLIASEMPKITYLDKNNKVVQSDGEVEYSVYDITIKPNIYYHPHPCFAKNQKGEYLYHALTPIELAGIYSLRDFPITGTRELVAEDFVYEIKRIADPRVSSPIYGLMSRYIVGMTPLHDQIFTMLKHNTKINLRTLSLSGVKVIDRYHYQITLRGKYPQFKYWLAMPFFTAIPWEADHLYQQPGMADQNITFDWQPVGTGAFYLAENNPNQRMVLKRNSFYHDDYFPTSSKDPQDYAEGYLKNAGKKLPFLEEAVFDLEKEAIPRWNKFLQGYYDTSGVSSDSFDQAIHISGVGSADLTEEMKQRGIYLQTEVSPTIYYMGFNMLDPVVGGNSERARKLRHAIAIAIDFDDYIAIFNNGRGLRAEGPIAPGIFGFNDDKNPITHQSLETAKKLLAEAGYPGGQDALTGQPLVLNYDVTSSSGPDDKARFDWMRKQFQKINIQLNIRSSDFNRFQRKMHIGATQIFMLGWVADYPDPENFFFLLYGPNAMVKLGGENSTNYTNAEFDKLFEQMKIMENSPERQAIINRMVGILREDSPWIFGFFPKDFVLNQRWVSKTKFDIATNSLKYAQIDAQQRNDFIMLWNKPKIWPVIAMLIGFLLLIIPVVISYIHRERTALKQGI
ncbi:MAG: ABC transporter substrate-binding protein [Pseudomonadota bacterium]|nr:ABC transporter substrate-binding protein [Pseudomonadota bacterium]